MLSNKLEKNCEKNIDDSVLRLRSMRSIKCIAGIVDCIYVNFGFIT